MKRSRLLILLLVAAALLAWRLMVGRAPTPSTPADAPRVMSQPEPERSQAPGSSEPLLEGYADPATPPIEDLRKIHRVATGYFSVVKDPSRYPIGGNADLAAALKGENPNREVFVRGSHAIFSPEGLIKDRWGSPLIVHPEAWRQLELRAAGPDKVPYTADDLILTPKGTQAPAE